MNCVITGAAGMLGSEIRREFVNEHLYSTDLIDMDVSDELQVERTFANLPWKPDYILHLAAETDLEMCETNPDKAYDVNSIGTYHLVNIARRLDVPLVYMSTAGIFSGKNEYYIESSPAEPQNVYGRSKYIGECFVNGLEKHYIFRMSWAMGGGPNLDKKFVNKVIKLIRSGAEQIYGITDIYGSPTYTRDVAKTIKQCMEAKIPFGTYHTAGLGEVSRFGVARAIIEILNLPVELIPVTAEEFSKLNKDFPCRRAHNEVIISTKDIPSAMRPWRDSLEEYLLEAFK